MSCEAERARVEFLNDQMTGGSSNCASICQHYGVSSEECLDCHHSMSGISSELAAAKDALAQCLANATATRLLQTEGYVTFLTVHEQGSGYGGGGTNFIDADVVFKLDSRPDKAFGFYLRNDDNQPIRQGMLDLVRDAMTHGLKVTTDFTELVMPPNQNSFVLRVSLTKLPEPGATLQIKS